jgi:hypothetical protein
MADLDGMEYEVFLEDGICLYVIDSLFVDCWALRGGGLFVAISERFFATSTAFIRCSAINSGAWGLGGALCTYDIPIEISRCCFREDESDDYGNAIAFCGEEHRSTSDSTFLACRDRRGQSCGGIYSETHDGLSMTNLNFSDCVQSTKADLCLGAVLFSVETMSPWSFAQCTVVRCSAGSGLESRLMENIVPTVELTNFYNNSCNDDDGLLSGADGGFNVDRCIFSGNSRELFIYVLSSKNHYQKFSVTNCVFSGSLPAGNLYELTESNSPGVNTESLAYSLLATSACAHFTPRRTPSQSPEETPAETLPEATEQTLDETSVQPSEETPAQTPEETPAQTSEETPAPTSEETPAQTSEETPVQTSEETPAQTSEETPAQTSEETPAQTSEETPVQTIEETPAQTSEETPVETTGPTGLTNSASFTPLPSVSVAASTIVASPAIVPAPPNSVSSSAAESLPGNPRESSTASSSPGSPAATAGNTLSIVGSIVGVIVALLVVAAVLFAVWHRESTASEGSEIEFTVPEVLQSGSEWQEVEGGETENPLAPSDDIFASAGDGETAF